MLNLALIPLPIPSVHAWQCASEGGSNQGASVLEIAALLFTCRCVAEPSLLMVLQDCLSHHHCRGVLDTTADAQVLMRM